MLISQNKSKPRYRTLAPDATGASHLLIGHGAGRVALIRLAQALAGTGSTQHIEIHYATPALASNPEPDHLTRLPQVRVHIHASWAALEQALQARLATARMSTRLYIAGSETFIWAITNLAAQFDIREAAIQQERADPRARRVVCVHCRAVTDLVSTNIVPCCACGRQLLVRDHFSRRLNAYMGLQVDAEVPGVMPPVVAESAA